MTTLLLAAFKPKVRSICCELKGVAVKLVGGSTEGGVKVYSSAPMSGGLDLTSPSISSMAYPVIPASLTGEITVG